MPRRNSLPTTSVLLTISLMVSLIIALPGLALAQTAGWKTEAVGKTAVITPPDLGAGESYQIVVFPRVSQGGAVITDFLDQFAARAVAAMGKADGGGQPSKATNHTVAGVSRLFVTKQGQGRIALFTALSLDGQNARVVAVVCSQNAALLRRYQAQASAVIKEMVKQEKAAAQSSGRGLAVEKTAPAPRGMTPGGKIVPGIYAGNAVTDNDGEIRNRFRLYLYASGEYLLCNSAGEKIRFGDGDYSYDPITGKMSVGRTFSLNNNSYEPDEEYCLYGRGADGKPYIHASDYRGYGSVVTILRYVGPTDQPSPKQQEASQAAAEAEKKRYKYVTAPGKGVGAGQIAAIVHNQTLNTGAGVSSTEDVYLLLKDGTVHDGLPVPPDTLDVSLSRRREPQRWGHWHKQGAKYVVSWPDSANHFTALRGDTALPARPGERLSGRFGTGETSGSPVFGGSYRLWGVTFTPGGRFLKDGRGGSSSGTLGTTMNDFSVDTTYDDEGSYTSAITPSTVVGAGHKKPAGHRGGTYSLSGYVLTLRYDDGRVARLPFFFSAPKRDQIYFEGANLAFDDGK